MNTELFDALEIIEKEKNISRESILDAIKQSLVQAVRNQYQRSELANIEFELNEETKEFEMFAAKTVVEDPEDDLTQISLADARMIDPAHELGDVVRVRLESKNFGRIVTQNAKNVILQKIREEERKSLYNEYYEKANQVLRQSVIVNLVLAIFFAIMGVVFARPMVKLIAGANISASARLSQIRVSSSLKGNPCFRRASL